MSELATFEGDRAQLYDQSIPVWMPNYTFLQDLIARLLVRETQDPSARVLVAGCGTGNDVLALHHRSPTLNLVGVDHSPEMIDIARQKTTGNAQIELVEGELKNLPLEPPFAAATLVLVLHFLPDDGAKLQLLQEIASRLQPGAPFYMADVFGTPDEMKANLKVLQALLATEVPLEVQESRLKRIYEMIRWIPENRLIELLEEAGFETPLRFYQGAIYGAWKTRRRSE